MDGNADMASGGKADAGQPVVHAESGVRRPWSTPVVIVSELRHAGAHVSLGSDGTDSDAGGYQYGS